MARATHRKEVWLQNKMPRRWHSSWSINHRVLEPSCSQHFHLPPFSTGHPEHLAALEAQQPHTQPLSPVPVHPPACTPHPSHSPAALGAPHTRCGHPAYSTPQAALLSAASIEGQVQGVCVVWWQFIFSLQECSPAPLCKSLPEGLVAVCAVARC